MAALVTATCIVLAYPIAFYMAKVASPRTRGILAVAVLMPLWASYLIKAYSWRLILSEDGVLDWVLKPLGLSDPGLRRHRDLADLHLPLAAVHDPADLRRPRADPEFAARGLGGPRRARLDDVPPGHPADVDPGRRRRARSSRSR